MMKAIEERITTKPSQQLTAPHLRRLIWGSLLFAWAPFAALAAAVVVDSPAGIAIQDPLNIPTVLLVLAVIISSLAGATALLMRIDRELSAAPDKPLPRPWIMCASHMAGAWLAGVAAFIIARQYAWDVWATLGFVLVASFGNAKFLESLMERYIPARIAPTPPPNGGQA